jgi:hypothetical protein
MYSAVILKCYNSTAPNWYQTLSDIFQKAKTIMDLVISFSWRPELRFLPHIDIGEPPFHEPYGSIQKYMEDKR